MSKHDATLYATGFKTPGQTRADYIAKLVTAPRALLARERETVEAAHLNITGGPSISTINPGSKVAGAGTFVLTVNGSGFDSGSKVHLNGTQRTTTFVSPTRLNADILAADIASAGSKLITVRHSSGAVSNTVSLVVTTTLAADADAAPASVDDDDYPFTGTVADVKAWVGEDLAKALSAQVNEQLRAQGSRASLLTWLEAKIAELGT